MKKIFLIAGHHDNDSGATAGHPVVGDIKEADLTRELRDLLIISLRNFNPGINIMKDEDSWTLPNTINWINTNITEIDLMIDIHFNAFANPKANGTETVVKNGFGQTTINLAEGFSKVMADSLEIKNRGVKTESQSGRPRIGILHGKGTRILLEIIFITNENDVNQYHKNKHLLVDALTIEIEKFIS